jgi:hypothetical protein
MNMFQFLERWPAKEGRLFFFGGGKDHDRLSAYYLVADAWRKKTDKLDFVRLHNPSMIEVAEACRRDPLNGKFTVVAATEMKWEDPDDSQEAEVRARRTQQFEALKGITASLPRDLVLIMSTPFERPLTKNPLAQSIITKGYWVVLTQPDVETAVRLLNNITTWDQELIFEVVESVGPSPAELLSFLRVVKLAGEPTPERVRGYLQGSMRGGVFELVDAIVMRDADTAFRLAANDPPLNMVLGQLDRKITSLLQYLGERRRGRSPKEAAQMLRMPGFVVHGLYEAEKRWRPAELLELFSTLAEYASLRDRPGALDLLINDLVA